MILATLWRWKAPLAAAVLGAWLVWPIAKKAGHHEGRAALAEELREATRALGHKADEAQASVEACKGTWNRETHRCEP